MLGGRRFPISRTAAWSPFVGILSLLFCTSLTLLQENIELYNIICDSIGVNPAPNNGTLRLPLKPVGLHTDAETPPDEIPPDPVSTTSNLGVMTLISYSGLTASASGLEDALSSVQYSSIQKMTSTSTSTSTSISSASTPIETAVSETLWGWLSHKAENIENWVEDFLHKHAPGDKTEQANR